MQNVKLHWFVDQQVGNRVVDTRFESEDAARRYAAAVSGEVRRPREAEGTARVGRDGVARFGIGAELFEALSGKEN